jgi:hypothetical protein
MGGYIYQMVGSMTGKAGKRRPSAGGNDPKDNRSARIPGKSSPGSRWRRVLTLAEQAVEALHKGHAPQALLALEAIAGIARRALEDLPS